MKFKIDEKIFQQFPSLVIGVVVATNINNKGKSREISDLIEEQSAKIKLDFTIGTLQENSVVKAWQEAYRSFGAKPKKHKSSIESLYRLVLEGVKLRHINRIVDIYNYISLKHMTPIGGDDTDKVDGDIILKFAQGNERFTLLNSDRVDNPKKGEVVYMDNKEILCRRWNWRECDKSKMTENTKNVTLVVEGLLPVSRKKVQSAIDELTALVKKFCGGEIKSYILNSRNKEIDVRHI